MPGNTEFHRRVAAIEELVRRLETATDPEVLAAAQTLVGAVMELHRESLQRILAVLRRSGAAGTAIQDSLARDQLIASVLLLHDLHPQDLESRVRGALEKTRPYLQSHGGNVELVDVDATRVVRLRLEGSCHGCPSSALTLKLAIEQAIHEAAPDVTAIEVEGRTEAAQPRGPALVGLSVSAGGNGDGEAAPGWTDVRDLGLTAPGATNRRDLDGWEVLFCLVESTLYAYGARCPACEADVGTGRVAGRRLTCPGCGQAYDLIAAGRAFDRPDLQLIPIPLLTRDGCTQVALPPRQGAADLAPV
jgi:Fe-S cluster biogenesis protein NfuA/nitrite reductase/ring-hydroxylating ferredoxin subunit